MLRCLLKLFREMLCVILPDPVRNVVAVYKLNLCHHMRHECHRCLPKVVREAIIHTPGGFRLSLVAAACSGCGAGSDEPVLPPGSVSRRAGCTQPACEILIRTKSPCGGAVRLMS